MNAEIRRSPSKAEAGSRSENQDVRPLTFDKVERVEADRGSVLRGVRELSAVARQGKVLSS